MDQTCDIIKLNVGGIKYITTKTTLCIYADSIFPKLLDNKIPTTKIKDYYFLDRDGKLFNYILNFLRSSLEWECPHDLYLCKQLLTEAKFYQLSVLEKLLIENIELLENEDDESEKVQNVLYGFSIVVIENEESNITLYYHNTPRTIRDYIDEISRDDIYNVITRIFNIVYNKGYELVYETDQYVDSFTAGDRYFYYFRPAKK